MPKKLIEVALPLEAINKAAAKEKSIRHGHPSTLHLWWARRPLAAARAVLFAQLVDDPSTWPELEGNEEAQKRERLRLFQLIEDMVPWEATQDERLFREVRREIARSHARFHRGNPKSDRMLGDDVTPAEVNDYLATELPPVHDPFAGGGTIPLEAQRLGLRAIASDLNPVAVLINKALIEIPPKFAGKPPINPESSKVKKDWKGAEGLAEDVRYYGKWMRDEAFKRIGHLYPKAKLPKELGGGEATVIAWLWARTVRSPDPRYNDVHVPLVTTWWLSRLPNSRAWVRAEATSTGWSTRVERGSPPSPSEVESGTKTGRGGNFQCLISGAVITPDWIRTEALAGRLRSRLIAVVAEGSRGRVFVDPDDDHQEAASAAVVEWKPQGTMPENPRWFSPPTYGLKQFSDLFTPRQTVALDAIASTIKGAHERIASDAAGSLSNSSECADAICLYLSMIQGRLSDRMSNVCSWDVGPMSTRTSTGGSAKTSSIRNTFSRQAIQMTWDFAEASPFNSTSGGIDSATNWVVPCIERLGLGVPGIATQSDVQTLPANDKAVTCTDPPYYDNIGYADLSDFFYIWLRRSLSEIFPKETLTLTTPKSEELIATPVRHNGSKTEAAAFFERGMAQAIASINRRQFDDIPATIFYAFRQSESAESGALSTGWERFLEASIGAGFAIVGTWPMSTEMSSRLVGRDANALASSIIIVCRKRPESAATVTRAEFLRALKRALPRDLKLLQQGNIAPVDFAQAAIGPGMAVYSFYAKVVESDGTPLKVRTALQLINQVLDEVLSEQEGDFDGDTRWALAWFEQHQYAEAEYGVAETLSKAKNTSVTGLVEAGILTATRGKVKLRERKDLDPQWDPAKDPRRTVWEVCQHMIRALDAGGERAAAAILGAVGAQGDAARELAYRLYALCERKKWSAEALGYNALVTAWPELLRLAAERSADGGGERAQGELFG